MISEIGDDQFLEDAFHKNQRMFLLSGAEMQESHILWHPKGVCQIVS